MTLLIAIIDDDQDNLNLVDAILSHSGFETLSITSAHAALEILARITPSIVILNLLMSPMNGFELSGRIREMAHLTDVPIIMLSAQAEFLILHRSATQPVSAFLAKPVKRQNVLSLINRLIGTARRIVV